MSEPSVVEVYRARNGFQARLFVTALEEAGIKAVVQGDVFHPANESTSTGLNPPWWDAPRILVFANDAERARQILLELEGREGKS